VFKFPQIDMATLEANAFSFEQKTLLQSIFSAQRDPAAGAQYPLPGRSANLLQHSAYVPRAAWVSGGLCNRAIGADAATWHLPDRVTNSGGQRRLLPEGWHIGS